MATSTKASALPPPGQARTLPVPIGFYTPPDYPADSFADRADDVQKVARPLSPSPSHAKLPPIASALQPSPPVSPENTAWANFRPVDAYASSATQVDPPLFPGSRDRAGSQTTDTPLFLSHMTISSPKLASLGQPSRLESHADDDTGAADGDSSRPSGKAARPIGSLTTSSPSASGNTPKSKRTSQSSSPHSPSSHAEMFNIRNAGDAVAYFHERMRELKALRSINTAAPTTVSLDPYSKKQVQSLGKPTGVVKSKAPPRSPPKPTAARSATVGATTTRPRATAQRAATPKRSPRAKTLLEFEDAAWPQQDAAAAAAQQEKKHKRAAPTKSVAGKEDNNKWTELPDFCPPLESLDDPNRTLKVEWKHAKLDCSNKEDVDRLHPQERQAAEALRLEPRQYLANKRRIFVARVEQLRNPGNKGWNKTACQQACNIDVNKASQLYDAFARIGWFDERWFRQWL